jgi:phage shock protein PspC (stress-responsive transcriptional regulator)
LVVFPNIWRRKPGRRFAGDRVLPPKALNERHFLELARDVLRRRHPADCRLNANGVNEMGQNLFTRDDTFFGVCQGLGDDFGFSPNWLRLVFGVSLLWNPPLVLAAYFGLGLIVATSRLVAGDPRPAAAPTAIADEVEAHAAAETAPAAVETGPAQAAAVAAEQDRVPLAA